MSGSYDLSDYTKGYHDEDVYFNSPMQYVPNLNDPYLLAHARHNKHIHLITGAGSYEDPDASRRFSGVLNAKGIAHELDVWGHDIPHDWSTWRKMLPYYLETRF
jgi:esterase/lipase superfamily enzyme